MWQAFHSIDDTNKRKSISAKSWVARSCPPSILAEQGFVQDRNLADEIPSARNTSQSAHRASRCATTMLFTSLLIGSVGDPFTGLAQDFGDAPDPTYPTLIANGGVQHSDTTKEWIGPIGSTTTIEADALQPDGDTDDATTWLVDIAARLFVITRVSHDGTEPGVPRYLNVLVDLSGDGAWDGSSVEWPVQNYVFEFGDIFPAGTNSGWLMLGIDSTAQAADYLDKWARVTLSTEPVSNGSGRWGVLARGETEDHQLTAAPIIKPSSLVRLPVFLPRRTASRHGHLHAVDQADPDADLQFRFPADAMAPCCYRIYAERVADNPANNPYVGNIAGLPLPVLGAPAWSAWVPVACPPAPGTMKVPMNGSFLPGVEGDSDFRFRVQLKFDPDGEMVFMDTYQQNVDGSITSINGEEPTLANFINLGRNRSGFLENSEVTPQGDSYDIVGGGFDIWDKYDEFSFQHKEVTGDFDVRVRVESLEASARWSKAGLMARETMAEDSRMFFARVTPPAVPTTSGSVGANDTFLAYRTGNNESTGGFGDSHNGGRHEDIDASNPIPNPGYPNAWLRLVRIGTVFTAFNSPDGVDWKYISSQDTREWELGPFSTTVALGLAVSQHNGNSTAEARFRNFHLEQHNPESTGEFSMIHGSSRGNPNGVRIEFNQPVGAGADDPLRYDVSGAEVLNANFSPDNPNTVLLETSTLLEGTPYSVIVNNVANFLGDPVGVASVNFVHGDGYEERRIHSVRSWYNPTLPDYLNSVAYQRGIGTENSLWGAGVQTTSFFEDPLPSNQIFENFSMRILGLLNPSVSGAHTLVMSSDDQGELYLSTDEEPANRQLVAAEPQWNGRRQWNAGNNQPSRGDPPVNKSEPIELIAGKNYYMEMTYREGGGGNNGAVAWVPPGGSPVVDGSPPISQENFVSSRFAAGELFHSLGNVVITKQPVDGGIPLGGIHTFTISIDGTPPYSIQWEGSSDGELWGQIPGANNRSLTVAAGAGDDGMQFRANVANEFSSVTSGSAMLAVQPNPVVVSCRGVLGDDKVIVKWNKPVDRNGQYLVDDGAVPVLAVEQGPLPNEITLTTGSMDPLSSHTLLVTGVTDLNENPMVPSFAICTFVTPSDSYCVDFTAVPPFGSLAGSGRLEGGVLSLTDGSNNQNGSFYISDFTGGATISGFRVLFRTIVGFGTVPPADGFSLNFADDPPPAPFDFPEEGGGNGLSITYDTWDNGGSDTAPAIEVVYKGEILASQSMYGPREGNRPPNGPYITDPVTGMPMQIDSNVRAADVMIFLQENGKLNVDFRGAQIFNGLQTDFKPTAGNTFFFGARTGGATAAHLFDDLCIDVDIYRPPTIRFQRNLGTITLIWENGFLESAPTPDGPWGQETEATSPHNVNASAAGRFYRAGRP